MILFFDPGAKAAGCAVFGEDRKLAAAYLARGKDWHETALAASSGLPDRVCEVVIERPQIYQGRKQKGDPNDLITLAEQAGYVAALATLKRPREYKPAEWKKQLPKEIVEERVKKRLSAREKTRVQWPRAKSLHHNIWDAIGLGLVHYGRLVC